MPRANGQYSLPAVYVATPGTTVRSEQHNVPLEDIGQALTNSLPRDGSAPMLANLPMGGRKVTGLGTPTATGDAATKSYVDGKLQAFSASDLTVGGQGVVGRSDTGPGQARIVSLGNGLDFNDGFLRVTLRRGLEYLTGGVAAVVYRFATTAEAQAGTFNDAAMSPLNVTQYMNANALGYGQSWQVFGEGARPSGGVHTNNTGRPIQINAYLDNGGGTGRLEVSPDGSTWTPVVSSVDINNGDRIFVSGIIVPPGHRYRAFYGNFRYWRELR